MSDRKCAYCEHLIELPHVRVWEEDVVVSKMITFCSWKHMVAYYLAINQMVNLADEVLEGEEKK